MTGQAIVILNMFLVKVMLCKCSVSVHIVTLSSFSLGASLGLLFSIVASPVCGVKTDNFMQFVNHNDCYF